MNKEEKIINGILHYRTSPNGDFKPYTLEDFTGIVGILKEVGKQEQEKDFEIERYRAIDFAKWFADFNGLTWEEKRVSKERLNNLYEKYLGTLGGGLTISKLAEPDLESNTIFFSNERKEMLKLCPNGDIFVNGRLVENDKEVVDGLRKFLSNQGLI